MKTLRFSIISAILLAISVLIFFSTSLTQGRYYKIVYIIDVAIAMTGILLAFKSIVRYKTEKSIAKFSSLIGLVLSSIIILVVLLVIVTVVGIAVNGFPP